MCSLSRHMIVSREISCKICEYRINIYIHLLAAAVQMYFGLTWFDNALAVMIYLCVSFLSGNWITTMMDDKSQPVAEHIQLIKVCLPAIRF